MTDVIPFRRPQTVGDQVYRCLICQCDIYLLIRDDHFPSCRLCRAMCALSRGRNAGFQQSKDAST